MPTSAATSADRPLSRRRPANEAGFALVEMLVAMLLLSLVGLTLARFQTFQLAGTASARMAAAARLEADNRVIDALAAPQAPVAEQTGSSENMGHRWHWTITPAPTPDPALMPDMVQLTIHLRDRPGGPVLVRRSLLRPRTYRPDGPALPVAAQ